MKEVDIKALLCQMTMAEKVGQLVQLTPNYFDNVGEITGPLTDMDMSSDDLYRVGSVLGTHYAEQVYAIQRKYLEKSRLKIPLLFMADVIHGYETIFPIPLALSSSFDPSVIRKVAKLSAREATRAGISVTFSPMVDLVKDPRWGRVLESNGEDPYLNQELTKAYIEGYQWDKLANVNTLATCVKHFIGYGAAEGGRDYNSVNVSDLELYQNYLPAFETAIKSGAPLIMTAFNTIRGIPVSANKWLLKDVLRKTISFDGVVISDWAAIQELVNHRVACDSKEAAKLSLEAGVDIDMMTHCYQNNVIKLIEERKINKEILDQAVYRVLELKQKIGLFDDPYRGLSDMIHLNDNAREEKKSLLTNRLRQASQEAASQSMVLLKNDNLLPIKKFNQKIGLIGPKATSKDLMGAWSCIGNKDEVVSLYDGLKRSLKNLTLLESFDKDKIENQDLMIIALGESADESGEAASRSFIDISTEQIELLKSVNELNSNTIVVLFNGRPLNLTKIVPNCKAILEAWFPGTLGGLAVTDILLGNVNPSGKLPMSFPRNVGQIPIYYNHLSTGRPLTADNMGQKYVSKYLDVLNSPLFVFGYGLSYSSFRLIDHQISNKILKSGKRITINVTIKNESTISGKTVVQLYLKDNFATIARPTRELKKFKKLLIEAGEEEKISFEVNETDLQYIHSDLSNYADSGNFEVFVGFDSNAEKIGEFYFVNE